MDEDEIRDMVSQWIKWSSTFIRIAESEICLSAMTGLVQMRFEELIPPDDRIILVDSRAVPFQDDEGITGLNILTDIDCTHDRVCMYIYMYI